MMSGAPTLSFELMPPRNPNAAPNFWRTAHELLAVHPDFLSITYGAGGSSRDTSRAVLRRLQLGSPVLPIAHLTCVGASREDVRQVVEDFLAAGVRSFLALRGDPPLDQPNWAPAPGALASAVELVALVREVEAERSEADPGAALRGAAHGLSVAVATFLNGNPAAGSTRADEVHRLLAKQEAGADFAITQLFYEADSYRDFLAEARAAGVRIPVLAGILPATSLARLRKVEHLSGVQPPAVLLKALASGPETETYARGIQYTADLAAQVLEAGAPGLHIYTFNQHAPALDLVRATGHPAFLRQLARR